MCVYLTAWAPSGAPLLLGAPPAAGDILTLFIMFAAVAVVALGGIAVAAAIRRWSQRDEPSVTFTFQDLREMRARGDISEAEFHSMRAALLAELDVGDEHGRAANPTGNEPLPDSPPDESDDEPPPHRS